MVENKKPKNKPQSAPKPVKMTLDEIRNASGAEFVIAQEVPKTTPGAFKHKEKFFVVAGNFNPEHEEPNERLIKSPDAVIFRKMGDEICEVTLAENTK